MAVINFPPGSQPGEPMYDPDSGRTWIWDGEKWELRAAPTDLKFNAVAPVELSQPSPEDVIYSFNIQTLPKLNDT